MPIATPQGTLDFKSVDTITFVGASSNTVIDTTTGSLGVGVGVGGPTSNLHVVGHTRLEGDINMLHTSNTASIKLNSNVVTEFPRSKKLIKYPRVDLTAASGESSGYQGYYVTESSNSTNTNRHSWKAFDMTFDNTTSDNGWANGGTNYTGTDYAYNGSANLGTGAVNGEWIKLHLPHKIKLEYMKIWLKDNDPTRIPEDWILYGSDDNTNWTELFSKTGQGSINENLYNVNATSMYNYLAVVVTKISGQNNYFRILELEYYGIPEYDPEAHGVDVVVKSVPNVPNTDWLEVYYDGQDYTQMPTTVTDKSGNNRTGTPSGGVGFDTEYKAFIFDGVDDYVTSTTLSSHFAGDPTVTYACWVKFNAMTTGQMFLTINAPGVYGQGVIGGLYLGTDGTIYNTVGNRGIQASEKLVTNRWYHLVATKIPGNTGTDTQKLYIDGVYVSQFPWNTSGNQVIGSNPVLRIGAAGNGNDRLNGYMANFRLFNRVLTSDEVWQLYAYQKEYFGHGDLGMTLKAGRLGIGTSEPRAALDVMGRLYGPGTIPCFSIHTADYWGVDYSSWGTTTGTHWNVLYRTPLPFIQRTWLEYDTHNVISFADYPTTTNTGTKTIFTAPMSGFYHFSFNIGFKTNSANDYVAFMLTKNDTEPYGAPNPSVNDYFLGVAQQIDVGMSYHIGSSVNIFLKKGETVVPYSRSVNSLYVSNGGGFNFSGYFIG